MSHKETTHSVLAIIGKSLVGGVFAGLGVFVLTFSVALILGKSPLVAFLVGPIAFFLSCWLGLLVQIRKVMTLPVWGRVVYGALVMALTLGPVRNSVPYMAPVARGVPSFLTSTPREERMRFALQLTDAERALLEGKHFSLTVAVARADHPPAYERSLIQNLQTTGLFDQVGPADGMPDADVVATIRDRYYGDRTGQAFTLALTDTRQNVIPVRAYYYIGPVFDWRADRRQYLSRLAVEVARAIDMLMEAAIDLNRQTNDGSGATILRVWKVGSPHRGDTPDTTVPFALSLEAAKVGAIFSIEGYPAQDFATRFFDALRLKAAPDVLVISNYGIIDGATTELGNFVGIGRDPTVKRSLVRVDSSFDEFLGSRGGWTFLVSESGNYELTRNLALRKPVCQVSGPDPRSDERSLITQLATAYLESRSDVLERYADPARLSVGDAVEALRVGSLSVCGMWGNGALAFVSAVASFEGSTSVGYAPMVLALRNQGAGWKLLTASRDPHSNGAFVDGIPDLVSRLRASSEGPSPPPAQLLSPPAGQAPSQTPGAQRRFLWRPSSAPSVIGEIAEFAYRNDARLFFHPRESPFGLATDYILEGNLWTTDSTWYWRIWSISATGDVVFSESRSFPN